MPEMTGEQFLSRLNTLNITVPIIMLTSDTDDLLEAKMAELGVAAFVTKGQHPKVLKAWIKNCLSRNHTATIKDTKNEDT